jgi:DNA repair exonuclease SbcCD ATPase subunit
MILTGLEIDYYKSFGEGISIDIPEGVSLLVGDNKDAIGMDSNEAGKTNFSETVAWCITGTPPDQSNADEVIHYGKDYCRVKTILRHRDTTLAIERKRTLSSGSNKLYFYINGELQNQETTVPSKVQKTINNYFGIKGTRGQILKDLMITNMLNYESVENFAKSNKDKERFNFISRIFNLEKWDDCREICREKRKNINSRIDNFQAKKEVHQEKLENTSVPQITENIKNAKNNIKKFKKKKKELQKEKDKLSKLEDKFKKKEQLKTRVSSIKSRIEDKKRVKKEDIKQEKDNIEEYNSKIEELKSEIESVQTSKEKLEEKLKDFNNTMETLDNETEELTDDISKKENGELPTLIKKIENRESELDEALTCPSCQATLMKEEDELKEFDKDKIANKIQELKSDKKDLKQDITNLKRRKKEIQEDRNNVQRLIDDTKDKIQTIKNNKVKKSLIEDKNKAIEKCKKQIEKIKQQKNKDIQQLKEDLEEAEEEFDEIKDIKVNDSISKNKHKTIQKIEAIEENIETTHKHKSRFETQLKNYKKSDKKVKELENKIKKEQKKYEAVEFWYNNFPEIKRMIIQSTLPNIEQLTNKYLEEMNVPLSIRLSTLEETQTTGNKKQAFNIKVFDKNQNKFDNFYSRSLGGRKRIGIALCSALQEIKASNLPNWFEFKFLDELLENLDSTGQDNIFDLISLKGQYIVTSHNNDLKDKFDNIIKVTKEDGTSQVKVISK